MFMLLNQIFAARNRALLAYNSGRRPGRTTHGLIASLLLTLLAVHLSAAMALQTVPIGVNMIAPAPAAAVGGAGAADQCKLAYPDGAMVTEVRAVDARKIKERVAGGDIPNVDHAQLRYGLELTISKLSDVLALANCGGKAHPFVLFLGGRPMPGLTAYPPTNPADGKVIFLLERTEQNSKEWAAILGRPALQEVPLGVSAGFEDSYPLISTKTITFRAIPWGWMLTWSTLMVVFAAVILWAASKTTMLRDGPRNDKGEPAMFSLARVQMTFWTFVILGSFAFVGMLTGDYLSTMNENVLGLMGISVGASLGASMIDRGAGPNQSRPVWISTGSWWRDILSDGKDISIHRFQMAAWTLVLGIIFLHRVYSDLAMPQFSTELLGLLGISAGTYLGLKVVVEAPENQPSQSQAESATQQQQRTNGAGAIDTSKPDIAGDTAHTNGKGP